ncbi:MAG: hypothetical protein K6G30_06365 [Acetatifactor sp.]|nr:hypothetical protein [Acetatifactor sp.]
MSTLIIKAITILGIILAGVFVLIISLILLLLFLPIHYRITLNKDTDNLTARAVARWLGGVITLRYQYPGPSIVILKFLGIPIRKIPIASDGKTPDNESEDHNESNPKQEKEKIKYTFRDIYDKINEVYELIRYYLDLFAENETNALLTAYFGKAGKLIAAIGPKHIRGEIVFGTGEPDTTGYLYGAYCIASTGNFGKIQMTPDFNQKILEGHLKVTGHVFLIHPIAQIFVAVFDNDLKNFIKRLKRTQKGKV